MNDQTRNEFLNGDHVGISEAEETLRLIARLPAPEGLEKRVQAGLAAQKNLDGHTARVLEWPAAVRPASGWARGSGWMRSAAAAAIVFVVVGGGWGVYSRVEPPQAAKVIVIPRVGSPGGFSNAGAVRTPHTLNGPTVVNPANGHSPLPATLAPGAKKSVRRTASATAKKTPVQPATVAK